MEKLYEKFYEAADDEGKAALVQERAAFLAYADAWQNLAGNEAAAYLMRVRCARMCCMIHTLPAGLPGSIVDSRNMLSGGEASEKTIREIGALRGSDSAVTELYAGAEARALNDVRNLLDETGKAYYGEAFVRGQRIWQVALDASVNGMYKAADKDARKLIIAWRTALDTLYAAEKPLMEMLYPDSNATVQEELMNLYKDAALDVSMMK